MRKKRAGVGESFVFPSAVARSEAVDGEGVCNLKRARIGFLFDTQNAYITEVNAPAFTRSDLTRGTACKKGWW